MLSVSTMEGTSLLWLLLLISLPSCTANQDLSAKRGANTTLECSGSRNATEIMLRWEKHNETGHVFSYKDGSFQEELQHDSFKGRVKMHDPKWNESGNFSVILKYITMNDTGRYQCEAGYNSKPVQLLNTINLTVHSEQKDVTAEPGQNVILSCQNPNDDLIIAVKWSRADLKSEYVISYREGQFDPKHQHPSFKDRVDLQDRKIKDGKVSLILKDVTVNDNGTYECHVVWTETNHMNRTDLETDPICIIYLSVVAPPGPPEGHTEGASVGLIVGLSVPAVLLVAAAVFLIYRKNLCRGLYHVPGEQPPFIFSHIMRCFHT